MGDNVPDMNDTATVLFCESYVGSYTAYSKLPKLIAHPTYASFNMGL